MEENSSLNVLDGEIIGIRFCLATHKEISTASVSGCSINHPSQLSNPFLGLPLQFGKCESCGTSEPRQCEGHFGYIELPIPIYHPSHISELKRLLSLLCLKCLKMKNKLQLRNGGIAERLLSSCCEDSPQVSVREVKTTEGASYLELKLPSRSRPREGVWNFLDRYGFHYGDSTSRTLLPCEVMEILRRIPEETKRKLSAKGYFPQDGYIMRYLPVPPNCLSVPDISDGVSVMSSDLSTSMLKKVLKQIEIIRSSRSGIPNFESHEVEANDLQCAVNQYFEVRGTTRSSRNIDGRFGISKDVSESSTKMWLEKMRTLFISKGSGFSSRSVITGEPYRRVNEIGIPSQIAQRITFEERVSVHNMEYLQNLVDNKLCLTYRDGSSTYSLREGSKGHTFLRPGQVVHRRIMDGDTVFIDRPPTTHKHSLQALSVYVHDDHTVKINPIICGPLSADFDGDCIHLFYPQSLAAKAEVLELFSVEKQLLSSHNGLLNLQLATDSLLSLRHMFKRFFFRKELAQQLSMFLSISLPSPALVKGCSGPFWTALQILQCALPSFFDYCGERYLVSRSDLLKIDVSRDVLQSVMNEMVTSILFEKGPRDALSFFDSLQPLLMENLFAEGFSVSLDDFYISRAVVQDIKNVSPLLDQLRSSYNELVELQIENQIRALKTMISNCIPKSSALVDLVDPRSDSATTKLVQQIGFLGQQLSGRRKFYSNTLVEDIGTHFLNKYPSDVVDYPTAEFGLIRGCFFRGLDPYEEMVHSISTREVIVRSSRGLSEPGTLFKNLMAILRDVAICYDGTVRNVSGNSVIQFEYGLKSGDKSPSLFPAGEPVGVLAATAMSNPAYKAVLDSTPSSNSSWELMKEILLCKVNFRNELIDRRVILYLNNCDCGRNHCRENAAYSVMNQLKKIRLKDAAVHFRIEYKQQRTVSEGFETDSGLVGHIHLSKDLLTELKIDMEEVLHKCQETINLFRKKKKVAHPFKKTMLSVSECCSLQQKCSEKGFNMPCLSFFWQDTSDTHLERVSHILADIIYPVLLETVIKGDPRICSANIIWVSPDTTTWARNPGELALDVVLEKSVVRKSGDAWRIVLDSCLPVLHLIDTKRSIPYAIKQVQELLGISCAFEQAVQRLSASVAMVAKGVLKEHLVLLANSMTCTGNMVGFNSGGYKALSRSLKVEVPFTEATLITPKKCFERAAEKCHTDSLSSIVASCAWGKRVAVGTGSRFDVLWDAKELEVKEDNGMDVYNFLHMVSAANGVESITGCLGAEVDDLVPEYETAEWSLSPQRESGSDKLIFEDSVEFQNNLDNHFCESNWEKAEISSCDGKDWGSEKFGTSGTSNSQADAWGNWQKDTAAVQEDHAVKLQEPSKFGGWDAADTWGRKDSNSSSWGTGNVGEMKTQEEPSRSGGWDVEDTWGRKDSNSSGWGAGNVGERKQEEPSRSGGWDVTVSSAKKAEDGSVADPEKQDNWSRTPSETQGMLHKKEDGTNIAGQNEWSGKGISKPKSKGVYTRDEVHFRSDDSVTGTSWDKMAKTKRPGDSDNVTTNSGLEWSGWGTNGGTSTKAQEVSCKSDAWGSADSWSKKTKDVDAWGNINKKTKDVDESRSRGEDILADNEKENGWDAVQSKSGWNSSNAESWTKDGRPDQAKPEDTVATNTWAQQKSVDSSPGWGCLNESNQALNSNGWDGPIETSSPSERNMQWGQRKGTKGWASEARRNRPSKSSGLGNDDGAAAIYTATRQRLDMFTSEEQDILSDVEPLMQSIRRIMHQPGFNDGDPLSADDQSFVVDKVFSYHPDKTAKMGVGMDYITVSKHSSFQESRCFYVVSTDGGRQDFSYRKCLDNFIRGKYSDLAEAFIGKYFRKPRSAGNQERNVVRGNTSEEQLSAGNQEQNVGVDAPEEQQ